MEWHNEASSCLLSDKEQAEETLAQAMYTLDPSQSREYFEAYEQVPELMHRELDARTFLRIHQSDVIQATQRLTRYWKYRKQIFQDRWLFPMTQTGTGALSHTEMQLLQSGYICPVPRPHQGPLLLVDEARLPIPEPGIINARVSFYMATLLAGDVYTQTDGVTVIYLVTSSPRNPPGFSQRVFQLMDGMPVKFKGIFVARNYEYGKDLLLDQLSYQQQRLIQYRSGFLPPCIQGHSVAETLQMLEQRGVNRCHLPVAFGGDFQYSVFDEWVKMRISMEGIMSSAPPTASLALSTRRARYRQTITPPERNTTTQTQPPTITIDSASVDDTMTGKHAYTTKTTTTTILTAHRIPYYQKQNNLITHLEADCTALRQNNENLRQENRKLETFLAQARLVAAIHGPQPADGGSCYYSCSSNSSSSTLSFAGCSVGNNTNDMDEKMADTFRSHG